MTRLDFVLVRLLAAVVAAAAAAAARRYLLLRFRKSRLRTDLHLFFFFGDSFGASPSEEARASEGSLFWCFFFGAGASLTKLRSNELRCKTSSLNTTLL